MPGRSAPRASAGSTRAELVLGRVLHLHAVQRLAVARVGLSADVELGPCQREQVAFVARIDEHAPMEGATVLALDRDDARAVLAHAPVELQTSPARDHDLRFRD